MSWPDEKIGCICRLLECSLKLTPGRQCVKFIITRATKGSKEEAVFTGHEERLCSFHGVGAFLSLQS